MAERRRRRLLLLLLLIMFTHRYRSSGNGVGVDRVPMIIVVIEPLYQILAGDPRQSRLVDFGRGGHKRPGRHRPGRPDGPLRAQSRLREGPKRGEGGGPALRMVKGLNTVTHGRWIERVRGDEEA